MKTLSNKKIIANFNYNNHLIIFLDALLKDYGDKKLKYTFNFVKNYISNIIFLFFIGAFSFFAYQNKSDLNNLFEFNLPDLSLLIVLYASSYVARAKMNQHLYSTKDISMSFVEALRLIINSTAGNLSTPFSLGTGYKFHYLKKNYNLNYTEHLNINIYYTLFTNLIYVLLLITISFFNYQNRDHQFLNLTFIWLLIFFIGLSIFFILSKEFKAKNFYFLNKYSLKSLNLSFSKIMNLFIYTSLIITVSVLSHIYLFGLLGLKVTTTEIIAYASLSGLANIIKFTPGNFGINETVLILSNLYHGLEALEIIISSLIFRFFSWLNILIFYFILNFKKSYNTKNK